MSDMTKEWQVEWIDVNALTPYAKNARRNDKTVPYLKNSIQRFGFKVPLVVDAAGVVVTGHTRLKAALELGMSKVPCVRANDLTEEEIKAFRLADNKIQEISEWDTDLLDTELLELKGLGFDMDELGFEDIGKDWGDIDEITEKQDAPSLEGAHNVIKVVVPPDTDGETFEAIKAAVTEAVKEWSGCEVS